jgi:hypothetical protein
MWGGPSTATAVSLRLFLVQELHHPYALNVECGEASLGLGEAESTGTTERLVEPFLLIGDCLLVRPQLTAIYATSRHLGKRRGIKRCPRDPRKFLSVRPYCGRLISRGPLSSGWC